MEWITFNMLAMEIEMLLYASDDIVYLCGDEALGMYFPTKEAELCVSLAEKVGGKFDEALAVDQVGVRGSQETNFGGLVLGCISSSDSRVRTEFTRSKWQVVRSSAVSDSTSTQ